MPVRVLPSRGSTVYAPLPEAAREQTVDSSDDNDEGIPATLTPSRTSPATTPVVSLKSPQGRSSLSRPRNSGKRLHEGVGARQDSSKRRRGAPAKRAVAPRTEFGQGQIEDGHTGDDDDRSAPAYESFYSSINSRVQLRDPPQPSADERLQEQILQQQQEDSVSNVSGRFVPDQMEESGPSNTGSYPQSSNEEEASQAVSSWPKEMQRVGYGVPDFPAQYPITIDQQHKGSGHSDPTREAMSSVGQRTPSRRPRKPRNKPKIPFDPRPGSPELGSEIPDSAQPLQVPNEPQRRGSAFPEATKQKEMIAHNGGETTSNSASLPSPGNMQTEAPSATEEPGSNLDDVPEDARNSVHIEPPAESGELITIGVTQTALGIMVTTMGQQGWTKGGKNWEAAFREQPQGNLENWLKEHLRGVELKPAKVLFKHIDSLRRFCRDIPKAPDFDGQGEYLRRHTKTLDSLIFNIFTLVERVANIVQLSQAETRAFRFGFKSLCQGNIPLLVLLLKEASMLGGADARDGKPVLPYNGFFTLSTVQILLRVTGWIERLLLALEPTKNATQGARELAAGDQSSRNKFANNFSKFQRSLSQAVDKLNTGLQAPLRRQQAIEKDRRVKATRETKERERREAYDRQMQMHVASTQMPNAESAPVSSSATLDEHEYAAAHDGWYFAEDERLLDHIRKVANPDLRILARLVPGRSEEEVITRVEHIRLWMWHKYHEEGIKPPRWCYEP